VFVVYTTLSVAQYFRDGTASYDLGIFTEAVKQYAHFHAPVVDIRAPGFDLLGEHFHPIVALLAPLFWIAPSPVTLLVGQAALVAVSVVPITKLAMNRLGSGSGYAIGLAYGFAWGLQNLVIFDFHEMAFAVPLVAFSLAALVDGRVRACVAWAVPLVFVKEDQGLVIAGIGLAMALRGRWRAGIALGVFGVAASAIEVKFVIPAINPQHVYPFWFDAGGGTATRHTSLLHHAHAAFDQLKLGWPAKTHTVTMLLLPTALLALFSPITLAIVLPLLLRFSSNNTNYWGLVFHYNGPLVPIVFVAAVDTLVRWRDRARRGEASRLVRLGARHGAVVMLAICVALIDEFPLSGFWSPNDMFSFGGRAAAAFRAARVVPDGVTVTATMDLVAPLAARDDAFFIGTPNTPPTEYVVVDNGSTNPNDGWSPQSHPLPALEKLFRGTRYRQIYADSYGFIVYRRVDR
jgi:uncharacterized membrane protein